MKVADVMTARPIVVSPRAPILEALRTMLGARVSGLPVVDEAGRVVGIVTEGDFLRRAETGTERKRSRWLAFLTSSGRASEDYVRTHGRAVEDVMSRDVATIGADRPLEDAVRLMEEGGIKRLPVTRDGHMVGIVTRVDLLRALLARLETDADASPNAAPDDAALERAVLREIAALPFRATGARVVVSGGAAHLHGMIADERQRRALRVAAARVAGVTEVHDHLAWIEPTSGVIVPSPEDAASR